MFTNSIGRFREDIVHKGACVCNGIFLQKLGKNVLGRE